jgi:hypothetical protein
VPTTIKFDVVEIVAGADKTKKGGTYAFADTFVPVHRRRFIELLITTFVHAIAQSNSGDFCPIFQRVCMVRGHRIRYQELLLHELPAMSGDKFRALLFLRPEP